MNKKNDRSSVFRGWKAWLAGAAALVVLLTIITLFDFGVKPAIIELSTLILLLALPILIAIFLISIIKR
jgi:hypothetical protein